MQITSSPSAFHRLPPFAVPPCNPPTHPIAYHLGCEQFAEESRHERNWLKRIASVFMEFGHLLTERAALAQLGEKDEQLLADIGLSRADLDCARRKPLTAHPTRVLSRLSRNRTRSMR